MTKEQDSRNFVRAKDGQNIENLAPRSLFSPNPKETLATQATDKLTVSLPSPLSLL